jgi:hypothetical protein
MRSIPSILQASRIEGAWLAPILLAVVLALGCSFGEDSSGLGGGGDQIDGTELRKGWFVDAGVEGLRVLVNGEEFSTGVDGAFEYRAGEVVEFFLGEIPLGSARVPSSGIVTPLDLVGLGVGDPLAFVVSMCGFVDAFCPTLGRSSDPSDEELALFVMIVVLVNSDADDDATNGIQITEEQSEVGDTLFLDFSDPSVFRSLSDQGVLDRNEIGGLFSAIVNPLRSAAGLAPIASGDVLSATWDAIVHFHGTLVSITSAGNWVGSLHASDDPGDHIMDVTARIDGFGSVLERFTFHDFPPVGRLDGMAQGGLSTDVAGSIFFDAVVDVDPSAVGANASDVKVELEGEVEPYVVRGSWDIRVDGQGGFESGDFWLDPSGVGGNALLHIELAHPGDRIRITGGSNDRRIYGFSHDSNDIVSVPVEIQEGMDLRFTVLRASEPDDPAGECRVFGNHIARGELSVYIDSREPGTQGGGSQTPFVRCSIF